jgi:uncharacterized protein
MKRKEEMPKIEFLDDCLLVNNEILVLGDVHLGYEDILAGKGIFPRRQLKDTIEKLNSIFWDLNLRAIKLKQIIICGDLKHEFGEISNAEWRETIGLLDFLIEKCENVILIKGNHDSILEPIARKKGINLKDYYNFQGVCFLHGHKIKENWIKKSEILIIAHLHPAITLSDEYKTEKYRCFLQGKWKRKQIYVLPSFSNISTGYDLTKHHYKTRKKYEFLVIPEKNLKNFEIIIYDNKEKKKYGFGKLKKFIDKNKI